MTTQEAIDELKYNRDMCYFDPSTGETGQPYSEECERMAQALDIAIEALKTAGDCISRQALKQAMYSTAFELDSDMQKWDGGCWIRYKLFEKIVDIMPPVQPQQKTATFYVDSEGYERCSACNEHESGMRYFKFCPNCGAKIVQSEAKTAGSVAK